MDFNKNTIDKNVIFTFWCDGPLDDFSKLCIKSWCRLGYDVHLYKYDDFKIDETEMPFLSVYDANEIVEKPDLNTVQEIADYFRFIKLYKHGGTWIDSDLLLLKRLPTDDTIISSEHCKLFGSYSPKDRKLTPNIGVLRFKAAHPVMTKTVVAINRLIKKKYNSNSNNNSLMKKFQKVVLKEYRDLVSHPNDYCGISWAYVKELYIKADLIDFSKSANPHKKFGIDQQNIDYLLSNSYGIHLWRNLYKTKNIKEQEIENSTFQKIIDYINENGKMEF